MCGFESKWKVLLMLLLLDPSGSVSNTQKIARETIRTTMVVARSARLRAAGRAVVTWSTETRIFQRLLRQMLAGFCGLGVDFSRRFQNSKKGAKDSETRNKVKVAVVMR